MEGEDCARIDSIINLIKVLNLQLYGIISQHIRDRQQFRNKIPLQRLRQLQVKDKNYSSIFLADLDKCMSEYCNKNAKDLKNIKISLPPIFTRVIRGKIDNQNFMRFQSHSFGIKYIFVDMQKECLMHLQIYRKGAGEQHSTLATRKLQSTYMNDLQRVIQSNQIPPLDLLQRQAKKYLEEIQQLMTGELCGLCSKFMAYNAQCKAFLPSTIKQYSDLRRGKGKEGKQWRFVHQGCL